jgi:hypothetical protein
MRDERPEASDVAAAEAAAELTGALGRDDAGRRAPARATVMEMVSGKSV